MYTVPSASILIMGAKVLIQSYLFFSVVSPLTNHFCNIFSAIFPGHQNRKLSMSYHLQAS